MKFLFLQKFLKQQKEVNMPARENPPRYLPRSLGVLWLWSGLQPALVAPGESLQLLAQIGVPPALQQPLFTPHPPGMSSSGCAALPRLPAATPYGDCKR